MNQRSTLRSGLAAIAAVLVLSGCSGITYIKYIQHTAATKLKLPNNTFVTAPAGKHYMLYIVNCIDNSGRSDAFFFSAERIRSYENQDALVNTSVFQHFFAFVGGNDTKTNVGRLILELPGPPEPAFSNLYYAVHETESVLMVNQTPPGKTVGASFWSAKDHIDIAQDTSSPDIDDPCADQGSFPH